MEPIKKILRTPSAFVLFLIAVVSLIGVIIKSETDKAIARMPIEATLTAEAKLTAAAISSISPTALTETPVPAFTDPAPTLIITATNTAVPTSATPQKVHTEVTGDARLPYSEDLQDSEILVGHGTKFQNYNEAVFLILGPGHFDFELTTGLWDKWTNAKPDLYDSLIKEQWDTLIRYGKSPILVVCDSFGCMQKTFPTLAPSPYVQSQENFPAYPASPISTPHVSLKDGELLVGTAVRFAARTYGCNTIDMKANIPYTIFLIRGPIELDLEIDNGGWDKWVNEFVYDKNVADSLLQPKRDELMKHDNYPLVGHVECIILAY